MEFGHQHYKYWTNYDELKLSECLWKSQLNVVMFSSDQHNYSINILTQIECSLNGKLTTLYVCMYVCVNVCMYICVYVNIFLFTWLNNYTDHLQQ